MFPTNINENIVLINMNSGIKVIVSRLIYNCVMAITENKRIIGNKDDKKIGMMEVQFNLINA
jgi:hypothetical protein